MIKTITTCNRCGAEIAGVGKVSVYKEREADAAGGMEDTYYHGHTCDKCIRVAFNMIMGERLEVSPIVRARAAEFLGLE